LFEIFVRDMADDPFDEFFDRERDKNFFVELSVVEPEGNRVAVECRDSCLGQDRAFGIAADVFDGEGEGIQFFTDVDIPDITLVEHVEKGIKGWISFQ